MTNTNHVGKTFNRLTALRKTGQFYKCSCSCGGTITVRSDHLASGHTKSCGCIKRELVASGEARKQQRAAERAAAKVVRDPALDALRNCWSNLVARCTDPKHPEYKNYGARGVFVCQSWLQSFDNFYSDMRKSYRKHKTIDRKNNDGGYEPANCRWATVHEQAWNRRNTLYLRYDINGKNNVIAFAKLVKQLKTDYHKAYAVYHAMLAELPAGEVPERSIFVSRLREKICGERIEPTEFSAPVCP